MYSSRGNISLKSQHYKKIVANGRRIADVPKEISRLKTSAKVRVVESDYKNYTSVFQQYYIALQVGEFDKPFLKKGTNVVFALRNDNQTQTQVRLKNLYSELVQNGERQLKHDYTLQTSDGVFLKGFPETLSQTEAQDFFSHIGQPDSGDSVRILNHHAENSKEDFDLDLIKVGVEILKVEQLAQAMAGLSASNNEAVGSQKPLKQRGAKIATISASNKESISHSMRFFDF